MRWGGINLYKRLGALPQGSSRAHNFWCARALISTFDFGFFKRSGDQHATGRGASILCAMQGPGPQGSFVRNFTKSNAESPLGDGPC